MKFYSKVKETWENKNPESTRILGARNKNLCFFFFFFYRYQMIFWGWALCSPAASPLFGVQGPRCLQQHIPVFPPVTSPLRPTALCHPPASLFWAVNTLLTLLSPPPCTQRRALSPYQHTTCLNIAFREVVLHKDCCLRKSQENGFVILTCPFSRNFLSKLVSLW